MKIGPIFFLYLFSNFVLLKGQEMPKGLPVGSLVENFAASNIHGEIFELDRALQNGPLVLIFIRGQWCPYCNKYLSRIQDSLSLIMEKNASVVVISPEKPEYIEKTMKKSGATFDILYDKNQDISDAFQLLFTPNKTDIFKYNVVMRAKLKESHTDDSQKLPVPATYTIDQNKKIIWRHFDENYANRASIKQILEQLEKYSDP